MSILLSIKNLVLSTTVALFMPMIGFSIEFINSNTLINPTLSHDAIIRMETGFEKDFLVLHCLIKQFKPSKLFEVGTCEGYGTLIMANACPTCHVISLDLPPHSPPFFHHLENIGKKCTKKYQQVFGSSLEYNYDQHFPIDAWFIDGAHDYIHVQHETSTAMRSNAKLIVYHDADIEEVFSAILDTIDHSQYEVYRVIDTRVAYAVKKE